MAKEHVTFNSRLIAGRTLPGNKQSISLEKDIGVCYCWTTTNGISCTAVCDNEYPEKAAYIMINKLLSEFNTQFASSGIIESATTDQKLNFPSLERYM